MATLTIPAAVATTAAATAALRAGESIRPDRLFDDPVARALVSRIDEVAPEQRSLLADGVNTTSNLTDVMGDYLAVRTHFLDAHLLATADAGARQIVLLGSGLDARAERLPWPDGTTVYEVDVAEVHAFKQAVLDSAVLHSTSALTPSARRVPVTADLTAPRHEWMQALTQAGLNPEAPTSWLAEGLLFYLDLAACDVLASVAAGTPGVPSWFAGDYATSTPAQRTEFMATREGAGAEGVVERDVLPHAQPGPGIEPRQWLTDPLWSVSQTTSATYGAKIARPVPAWWNLNTGGQTMWMFSATTGPL
jgi:methyltransferase (TIGR00027 family)